MGFSIGLIPKNIRQSMIGKKIWVEDCPVRLADLRLVLADHYNFEGETREGKLIVHHTKAKSTVAIFRELYNMKFPIQQMKLMDDYNGDDELSMADNNSSCFNHRKIAGSDKISIHSYGLAIDINPLQNPALVIEEKNLSVLVHPKTGAQFLNRYNMRPGMIEESIVKLFKEHGFDVWGGNWNNPIDYQHFQVSRALAEDIVKQEI